MKKLLSVILLVFVLAALLTSSGVFALPSFTREAGAFTVDPDALLSEQTKMHVKSCNEQLKTDADGVEFVVVALKSLDGGSAKAYAKALFSEWKPGDAEKQNGVLLLVAADDGDYWVQQGSGLAQTLTDETLTQLLSGSFEAHFAAGELDAGITAFTDALAEKLTQQQQSSSSGGRDAGMNPMLVLLIAILAVIGCCLIVFVILYVRAQRIRAKRRRAARRRASLKPVAGSTRAPKLGDRRTRR